MSEVKWVRNDDWVGSPIEDNYVMVNIETGSYIALNASAQVIWDALETPRTAAEVEASVADRFEVAPDVCAAAVARMLGEMEAQQLARVA